MKGADLKHKVSVGTTTNLSSKKLKPSEKIFATLIP